MNIDTGELIKLTGNETKEMLEHFVEVPKELKNEAKKELGSKKSTICSPDSLLGKWAGTIKQIETKKGRKLNRSERSRIAKTLQKRVTRNA